jgi:hypothetical protein
MVAGTRRAMVGPGSFWLHIDTAETSATACDVLWVPTSFVLDDTALAVS